MTGYKILRFCLEAMFMVVKYYCKWTIVSHILHVAILTRQTQRDISHKTSNKFIIIVFNLTRVDQQISLILVTTVLDVVINLITKNNSGTYRLGCVSHHTVRSKFIFHQRFSIHIKAVEIIQNEGNVMKRRLWSKFDTGRY